MRLLIVAPTLRRTYCGVKDIVLVLIEALRQQHEVHLAVTAPERGATEPLPPGLPFIDVARWDAAGCRQVVDYAAENAIDVVDIQFASSGFSARNGAICWLPKRLKRRGIASVVSVHELAPPKLHPRLPHILNLPYAIWSMRALLSGADQVVSYSEWIPAWLNTSGLAAGLGLRGVCAPRIVYLPPTLAPDEGPAEGIEVPAALTSGQPSVVCPGLMARKRDCETVIRAVARIRHTEPRWHLVFAGAIRGDDRRYVDEMRSLADALDVPVTWTDGLSPSALVAVLRAGTVTVVSQRATRYFQRGGIDLNSSVLRNAAHVGRPVVAVDGPYVPDTIRDNVRLYRPGDAAGLATAILEAAGEAGASCESRGAALRRLFSVEAFKDMTLAAYAAATPAASRQPSALA